MESYSLELIMSLNDLSQALKHMSGKHNQKTHNPNKGISLDVSLEDIGRLAASVVNWESMKSSDMEDLIYSGKKN